MPLSKETQNALLIGFLKKCALGTALDDCGNHDDDSLGEIAARAGVDKYTRNKLRELHRFAVCLLDDIDEPRELSTSSVVALAKKHANNDSSRLHLGDAQLLLEKGNYHSARACAIASLLHSIGIIHDDFRRAAYTDACA